MSIVRFHIHGDIIKVPLLTIEFAALISVNYYSKFMTTTGCAGLYKGRALGEWRHDVACTSGVAGALNRQPSLRHRG